MGLICKEESGINASRELEKGSIILFTMLMIGNACSYLYQIIMGRMLSFEDYGALNALFSLVTIAMVPGAAITLVVSKYVAGYNAAGEEFKIGYFLRKSLFYISIFTAVVTAIGLVLAPLIKSYLMLDKVSYVVLSVVTFAFTLLLPIPAGTVQGLKRFWELGLVNLLIHAARLVLGIVFVLMGYKLNGALGGLAAGYLIAAAVGFIIISKKFRIPEKKTIALGREEAVKYGVPVLIVTLCLAVLTNMDMIMIKHYFIPEEAGVYGAAVIFGRAIYYFPVAVVMAMFPITVEADVLKGDVYNSLKKALLYCGVICGGGVLLINLFPELIAKLFFGARYLSSIEYIKLLAIAMLPMCLLNVIVNFSLAINRVKLTVLSLIFGCISEYVLIVRYHAEVRQVLYVLIGVGIVLLILNFTWVILKASSKELIPKSQ